MPMNISSKMVNHSLTSLNKNQNNMALHLNRVATGLRVSTSKDSPAAYSVSQRLQADIRSYGAATSNARSANDALSIADGAVASTVELLQTIREHALAAANATYSQTDRQAAQKEINQLIGQIDDNSLVSYNGIYMIDGTRNAKTEKTASVLINTSFKDPTGELSTITDRNGDKIIQNTDSKVTVSYQLADGTFKTTSTTVGASTKLESLLASTVGTFAKGTSFEIGTDSHKAKVYAEYDSYAKLTSKTEGLDGQISGLSITVTNPDGTANNKANSVLNNWRTAIFAADEKTGDNIMNFNTGIFSNSYVSVGFENMNANAFGLRKGDGSKMLTVMSAGEASSAVNAIDNALGRALIQQAEVGAIQARLEFTENNLLVAEENTRAAQSDIADADMAKEVSEYMKYNVLLQASQAMIAQANQRSGDVLYLLGGSSS